MTGRLQCDDCGEPLITSRRRGTHQARVVDGVVHRERVCRACGQEVRTVELRVGDVPRLAARWLRLAQER